MRPRRRPAHGISARLLPRIPDALLDRLPARLRARVRVAKDWYADADLRFDTGIPAERNIEYNQALWDWYSEHWDSPRFKRHYLDLEGKTSLPAEALTLLGEEWGSPAEVDRVVQEWILPHVSASSVVAEIGTGGGRIAARVAPHVGTFHAFDVAPRMLARARQVLAGAANTRFHLLDRPALDALDDGSLDFAYAFDVFVHLDLHTQWSYIRDLHRVLRPGGRAFLHTCNLGSDAAWRRFCDQARYRVEGFYFVVPEMVRLLIERAGLDLDEESSGGSGNLYYERDYLVLVSKPGREA